jgi:hypothetical protein
MFESLSRSWGLTKLSWSVLVADKEMLLFPLLGGLFSVLYVAALLFPTIITGLLEQEGEMAFAALEYAILGATYIGLAFIATFFNVCTVYTTKVRFDGGDATFMQSISFALSKLHLIFMWSLLAASVGMLLRSIDHAAERAGPFGGILLSIVRSILGAAWSVLTLFVVPAMVYEGHGPVDAIKTSTRVLKKTWGESLVRHFGLGWAQSLAIFAGMLLFVPLLFLLAGNVTALVAVGGGLVLYIIAVVLVFAVLNSVFNTALYVYAQTGSAPGEWDGDLLVSALRQK